MGMGQALPFFACPSLESDVGKAVAASAQHRQVLIRLALDYPRSLLHAVAVGGGFRRGEAPCVGEKLYQGRAFVVADRYAVPQLHALDRAVPAFRCLPHLSDSRERARVQLPVTRPAALFEQ